MSTKNIFISALLLSSSLMAEAYEKGDIVRISSELLGEIVTVKGNHYEVAVYADPDATIPKNLTIPYMATIGDDVFIVHSVAKKGFYHNEVLESVSLPRELNIIGESAFNGCTKLKKITEVEPGSVWVVGEYGLAYTYALESADFPGLVTINPWGFYLSGLKSIDLPSASILEAGAFQHCKSLENVTIGEKIQSIGNIAFCNCDELKNVEIKGQPFYFGANAFSFTSMTEFVIPYSLTECKSAATAGDAIISLYLLSPNTMDFIDEASLLRHISIKEIYTLPELVDPVNEYIATGSENNPVSTMPDARAQSVDELVEINRHGTEGFSFRLDVKKEDITDLVVTDSSTGLIVEPVDGLYTPTTQDVFLSYIIGNRQHLKYPIQVPLRSAAAEIESECGCKAEYFTLQGIRIPEPSLPGLYIRLAGTESKVISIAR